MGHRCVEASGKVLFTFTGLKLRESLPVGNVTQPWSPRNFATRFTPFGRVIVTVLLTRSTTGLPNFERSSKGAVKPPTFSAAKSGSRPVMNTAEHMTFAYPAA